MLVRLKPLLAAFERIKDGTAGEFAWIVLGQLLAALGGLVGFRILSAHVSPALWGEVLVWQTGALLINQVVVGGLAAAAVRHAVMAYELKEFPEFVLALGLLIAGATFVIIALVAAALFLGLGGGVMGNIRTLLVVGALGVFVGMSAILDAIQNAFRHRAIVALHQSLGQWLRFLLATGLVISLGASKLTVLSGFLLGSVLVLISQLMFARRLLVGLPTLTIPPLLARIAKWVKVVLRFGWPFAAWGVLNWLQTSVERWVIEGCLDARQLGIYGAASQLSVQPMTMLWGALMQLLSPIIFKIADIDGDVALVRKIVIAAAIATVGLGASAALVTSLLGKNIAPVFVGLQFRQMLLYWPVMLLVAGISGGAQILSVYALARHASDTLIFPRIVAGSIGIALTLILVPRLGLSGAIISTATAAVILGALNLRLLFRT